MFKKILLIISLLILASCSYISEAKDVTYNKDDVTLSINDYEISLTNNNDTYLIDVTYQVGNLIHYKKESVVLRPHETIKFTSDVYPSVYGLSEYTYYSYDYSIQYNKQYVDNIGYIELERDDLELVKNILKDEYKLSSLLNNYYLEYYFDYNYSAVLDQEDKIFKIYYRDELIDNLIL